MISDCISCRTNCKPEEPFPPLSADHRELSLRLEVLVGRGKIAKQEWGPQAVGPLLYVTHLCLQDLLGPNHVYTTSFEDGALLCTPSFTAWWVRSHLVHNGQLGSHGYLVAHG